MRGPPELAGLRSLRRERHLTLLCLAFTLAASAILVGEAVSAFAEHVRTEARAHAIEQVVFVAVVSVVLYGNLVYQATRLGFLSRRLRHVPADRAVLERVYDELIPPPLAILVPAYKEDASVVWKALLSAGLQAYPNRRVVLLIDDPPEPADTEAAAALATARRLPGELSDLIEKPAVRFRSALEEFASRYRTGALDLAEETRRLCELHAEAAAWFEAVASNQGEKDHADRLFVDVVLHGPARDERARVALLEQRLAEGNLPAPEELLRAQRRLAALFRVEIASFERKRFANLSHEPNKAMNLNAYIGLLGRSFHAVEAVDGVQLQPADPPAAEIVVPDADYLITLDADSILAPDYSLRLLQLMRGSGWERVAVVQTPYSAFPGAPGTLERVAGATTDIQYLIHQGLTRHQGTYWVGANALLRTRALRDIRTVRRERGHPVSVFIQDRTVIEDTESSIDLIARGWQLYNYPKRLAWSATPPDFGALLIQRRRWANGGLLILPKLLRYLARGPARLGKLSEGWVRIHYLTSIAGVNVALVALLCWPFEQALRSVWFPLAALPYFLLYARDLSQRGYPRGEIARAYALNLLLLPVNLAGVARSLRQAATGRKTPFGRTPKVPGRTAAPAFYHLVEWAMLGLLAGVLAVDLANSRWVHGSFVAVNGLLLLWAVLRLVGLRAAGEDLRLALAEWRTARGSPRAGS